MLELFVYLILLWAIGWLFVFSSGNLQIRAVTIVLVIACALYTFALINKHSGTHRTVTSLPNVMVIHGFLIDEYNDSIYLLMQDDMSKPPTYISAPYIRGLHEALHEGGQEHGREPFVIRTRGDSERNRRGGNSEQSLSRSDQLTFESYDLPQPELPEKVIN